MDDPRLVKVQGFLRAFEELNQLNNHVAGFFFEPLGAAVDPPRQVADFLSTYWGGDIALDDCALVPKADWRSWVERSAEEHFFAFASGAFESFFRSDEQRAQRRSELRDRLPVSSVLQSFFTLLEAVVGAAPVTVSVVRCSHQCIGDALWDGYLIQADDRLMMLWFGWSD